MKNNRTLNNIKPVYNTLPDKILGIFLYAQFLFIVTFALYTAGNPDWLVNFTKDNRHYEVTGLVQRGVEASSKGHQEEAISLYRQALEILPTMTEALANLAISYKIQKNNDSAIANLQYALSLSPKDSSNIYSNLVDIYMAKEENSMAYHYFKKSIETNPFIIDKFMQMGVYYLNVQNWDYSSIALSKALEERKNMAVYYKDMLNFTLDYKLLDKEEEENIKKKIGAKIIPSDLAGYDKKLLNKLLNRDRGNAENYNKLGYVLAKMKRYEEAAVDFKRALKIWPQYEDAFANLKYVNEVIQNMK